MDVICLGINVHCICHLIIAELPIALQTHIQRIYYYKEFYRLKQFKRSSLYPPKGWTSRDFAGYRPCTEPPSSGPGAAAPRRTAPVRPRRGPSGSCPPARRTPRSGPRRRRGCPPATQAGTPGGRARSGRPGGPGRYPSAGCPSSDSAGRSPRPASFLFVGGGG